MKKLSSILALLFLLSCANENRRFENVKSVDTKETEAPMVTTNTRELLIKSKLVELSEKQELLLKHPEFKTGVSELKLNGKVEDVLLLNRPDLDQNSDTIPLVVQYQNVSTRDTIWAYISVTTLVIEGEPTKTTTVKFKSKN